eukprot:CAMPEP_0184678162 /NCGR_PEP_ID=MMETSP0312-20130426/854_1 /TAXON_ID=31354 /ORGANISM="Compsopogon coeruleus, Strain SAG 36.94" /LENGTH=46 /DNA_ID= /DNA_START= /DNA_END= /DNA_ORIENTATION=
MRNLVLMGVRGDGITEIFKWTGVMRFFNVQRVIRLACHDPCGQASS